MISLYSLYFFVYTGKRLLYSHDASSCTGVSTSAIICSKCYLVSLLGVIKCHQLQQSPVGPPSAAPCNYIDRTRQTCRNRKSSDSFLCSTWLAACTASAYNEIRRTTWRPYSSYSSLGLQCTSLILKSRYLLTNIT